MISRSASVIGILAGLLASSLDAKAGWGHFHGYRYGYGVPMGYVGAPMGYVGAPLGYIGAPMGYVSAPAFAPASIVPAGYGASSYFPSAGYYSPSGYSSSAYAPTTTLKDLATYFAAERRLERIGEEKTAPSDPNRDAGPSPNVAAKISTFESRMSALESKACTLESRLNELEKRIRALEPKRNVGPAPATAPPAPSPAPKK